MSRWHLELLGWPWWLGLPAAIALAWCMARWLRPELAAQPGRVRHWLVGLRCVAVLLAVLMLLEPAFTRQALTREPPTVAVLIDQSGSMSVRDVAVATPVPSHQSRDRLILPQLTRLECARRFAETRLLPLLTNRAAVVVFAFDRELRAWRGAGAVTGEAGAATDFEGALAQLARQESEQNLKTVWLVTDGRQIAGGNPDPIVQALRARGTRLNATVIGSTEPLADAVVAELLGNEEVFVDDPVSFAARFRVSGDTNGAWGLVLRCGDEELDRRQVNVTGEWQTARFEARLKRAGLALFQVQLEPAPSRTTPASQGGPTNSTVTASAPRTNRFAEATLANNHAEWAVAVNEDPVRVYLADATPRWESRYLAALFERDRRFLLTRRYHSTLRSDERGTWLPPNQAAWDAYDVVVLGDLDSTLLPPAQQLCLANFVSRRGGFLVCVAGPRGLPRSYSLGALATILPVRVVGQNQSDTAPVTLALTEGGAANPITQILADPVLNQRLWPALPALHWTASAVVAKPGAQVLLEAQNPVHTPVAALQRSGVGRALWLGTSETWRWRDRLGERVHQTFWLQALRWGLAARLRGKDPRLQASVNPHLASIGDPIAVRARATNARGEPLSAVLQLTVEKTGAGDSTADEAPRRLEFEPMPDSADIVHTSVAGLPAGTWRFTVSSEHPELHGVSEVREVIVRSAAARELVDLRADAQGMARLALLGKGRAGRAEEVEEMVRDLAPHLKPELRARTRTLSLWDNYLVLVLFAGMLTAEWFLRKRVGLP
jgi:hypothetical protein